jgi:phage N-6-adenine-methyltransferase
MLAGFKARNHPLQVKRDGARDDVDDRALPASKFAALNELFRFTIDVAASRRNAKTARFYSRENCGLRASWAGERVYCNPPYSDIRQWVEKAWRETEAPLIVMLLPANRTEHGWWQDLVESRRDRPGSPLRVRFLSGRWRFIAPGRQCVEGNERPPFGVCLCIWDREGSA